MQRLIEKHNLKKSVQPAPGQKLVQQQRQIVKQKPQQQLQQQQLHQQQQQQLQLQQQQQKKVRFQKQSVVQKKDVRSEVLAVNDAVKKIKEVFALKNQAAVELRNKSAELNTQRKYIEEETQKEGEAVGIISACFAIEKKSVNDIEKRVNDFIKAAVELYRKERNELNRMGGTGIHVLEELKEELVPMQRAIVAELLKYRLSYNRLDEHITKKNALNARILDVRGQNNERRVNAEQLEVNHLETCGNVVKSRQGVDGLNEVHEKVDTDLRLLGLTIETRGKDLSNRHKDIDTIVNAYDDENETICFRIDQHEEEIKSLSTIYANLVEEFQKLSELQHRQCNDKEKYTAIELLKTNDLENVNSDVGKHQESLVDVKAKNKENAEELPQIKSQVAEMNKLVNEIKNRNASSLKINEERFSNVSAQLLDLHESTKLEPTLAIALARAKENHSRHIEVLKSKENESADLLKIAETKLSIQELVEEENALKSQLVELDLKNKVVLELEKSTSNLLSEIETVENDIEEKTKELEEISLSKIQKNDSSERSENVIKKVDDEVTKKLKKDLLQIQKVMEAKCKDVLMTIAKIKDRKITVMEKNAHVKELESLEGQIKVLQKSIDAEKEKAKEIEQEREKEQEVREQETEHLKVKEKEKVKVKAVKKKDSLPPPDPRTPFEATKKQVAIPQSSPAKSHVSDQSDNMFEDLVSQSFKNYNAKPTVRFSSQVTSQKETAAKMTLLPKSQSQSQSQKSVQQISTNLSDDGSENDDDEDDNEDDDDQDEDYVTEELSFIKVKSQKETKEAKVVARPPVATSVKAPATAAAPPSRAAPFTAPKQTKKRTSGYDSYDSLQSLNETVKKPKTSAKTDNKDTKQPKKLKMTPIEERELDDRNKTKPLKVAASQAAPAHSTNKNKTPNAIISKSDVSTKPAPLTKSNVAKFSLSQTNAKKRSRAWDDDSNVDFSKLM